MAMKTDELFWVGIGCCMLAAFRLMLITAVLVMAGSSGCCVSTGTTSDPLLVASGPTASEVLAVVPALRGSDRTALACPGLTGTDAGRLACALLVACALPRGGELDLDGMAFFGEAGLAPTWPDGGITNVARREVSACWLAHLSADGLVAVPSLRGRHLQVTPQERVAWTVQEGAFFGDLMAAEATVAACRGVGDPASSVRQERLCAQPDPSRPGLTLCDLAFAGECSEVCERHHDTYRECRLNQREFGSVVTSFVQP